MEAELVERPEPNGGDCHRPKTSADAYVEFLRSQGTTVVEISNTPWMAYCGALIPASVMPVNVAVGRREALEALKKTGALFLRHTTVTTSPETNWWHMTCDQYDISEVSRNTRSKIRRGMKRLKVRKTNPEWIARHGYECHVECHRRYRGASPLGRAEYQKFFHSIEGEPLFECWTCTESDQLLGYIVCLRGDNGVFFHTVDISPAGLQHYASYAMLHVLLSHYVTEEGCAVSNGSRSIAHATEMQEFLQKFGFQRRYCKLHVVYRPSVWLAVNVLYPFRRVLARFNEVSLLRKVASVLYQEELVRQDSVVGS